MAAAETLKAIHDAARDFKERNQGGDNRKKGDDDMDMVVIGAPKNVEPLISVHNVHTIRGRKHRTTDGDRP